MRTIDAILQETTASLTVVCTKKGQWQCVLYMVGVEEPIIDVRGKTRFDAEENAEEAAREIVRTIGVKGVDFRKVMRPTRSAIETNDFKFAVSAVNKMLNEPETGLASWWLIYGDHMKTIVRYWYEN